MVRSIAPFLIAFVLVLTGCTGSPVPLDEVPSVAVDEGLVGEWIGGGEDDVEAVTLKIFAFNDFEYYVEWLEESEDGEDELSRLRVFMSDIAGDAFVNAQCIDCDESSFVFLKLETSGDELLLTPFVSDDDSPLRAFETPDDARLFVTLRKDDADWLEEPAAFRRQSD